MKNNKISDQALDKHIAQLSSEMTPHRNLWMGVERALTQQEQAHTNKITSKGYTHLAWAASFIAAILLTLGGLYPQIQNKQTPLSLALVMEQDFVKNKQVILANYREGSSKVLSTEVKNQLKELASARSAINKALKADPNNSDLLNLLRWTQQQELDFLQKIYSPQWQTI